MPRTPTNRFGELEIFAGVVEKGGFSAAARAAGVTPSAVSKLIGRLEARLDARLVNRSTRQLQLTAEGRRFYESAVKILAELADAERAAGAGERAAGRVRLNASASYVVHVLAPILPAFLGLYPEIALDVVQTDVVVDLLADRTDVAIRAGPLPSSSLRARKLGDTGMVVAASPRWIDRNGLPGSPQDLARHARLGFGYARALQGWPFLIDGAQFALPAQTRVSVSDGEGIRTLALAGVAPARLARFTVERDLAEGRLVPLLEAFNPGDRESFHAVFLSQSTSLPARARVLLDYLAQHGRVA